MIVETRFSVGDRVICIGQLATGWFVMSVNEPVTGIHCHVTEPTVDAPAICYEFATGWEDQGNVFSTFEEARAECDRRNPDEDETP